MKFSAVVFDYDGVLADNHNFNQQAVTPIPGAIEFVIWCHNQNLRIAIGSGGSRPLIERYLFKHKLDKMFQIIITAEDVSLSKPNPETYLKVLAGLNTPANQTIIIENSVAGILAGQAAGCKVVGLTSTAPANKIAMADFVANSYQEIPRLIS